MADRDKTKAQLVAELVELRRKLSGSELLYQALFEQAGDGSFLLDLEGRIITVNQAFARMHGYTVDEMKALGLEDLDPEGTAPLSDRMQRILAGETLIFEVEHFHKDGHRLPLEVTTTLITRGEEKLILATHRDISERKAIRETEQRYRQAGDMMEEYVFEAGVDGDRVRLDWTSQNLKKITGRDISDSKTQEHWVKIIDPDDHPAFTGLIDRAVREQKSGEIECRSMTKSGRRRWINISCRPLLDPATGRTARIIGRVSDITERKQTEEALRQSENNFRQLITASPSAVTVLQDGRVIYANPEGIKMSGYEEHELIGRELLSLVHPDHREDIIRRLVFANSGKPTPLAEARLVRKGGEEIIVELASVPIEYSGRPATLTVGRDMSFRKQIEDERLKTQRLESIGVLAGGIAHDFNNILVGITGNLSIARVELETGGDPRESLDSAEKAADRARDLTRQLLTFARGGAPVTRLESVRDIITESVGFASHGANVKTELALAADLLSARVDAGQISQVLHNLVLNGIQAMPSGGLITISAENTALEPGNSQGLPPGVYVLIGVSDTGHGIPPEIISRIYDPYFTTKEKGNGLGLASCYSIVKRHHGKILVESEPGRGTSFRVYLPAGTGKKDGRVLTVRPPVKKGRGRILLMDDEENVRRVSRRMLEKIGYEVEEAEDGHAAVELFRAALEAQNPFRAVILDLTIPGGLGGKDAVAAMIKLDAGVRAIVASGYSNDPVLSNYDLFGFSGVVVKPYKLQELGEVLEAVIG